MRKFKVGKKILIVVLMVACGSGLFWWQWARKPVCLTNCQAQIFVIRKGEGLSQVAQKLEEKGLVRSSTLFQFEAVRLGLGRQVQAGDFRLNPGMTPTEIAEMLTHGTLDRWVTLIEGWRREEIALKLEKELGGEGSNFSSEEFMRKTVLLEGRLFPDTYLIPKDASTQRVISILVSNFERRTAGLNLDEKDLILASLIEREVKDEEDRLRVAGILGKRLKASWLLQVDATVQYTKATFSCQPLMADCEWWPKRLTKEDLKLDSSYNTYLYQGLPPAPICNPSLASIKASLDPVTTDYWFYLSDKTGKTHYGRTLEEHNQNIATYLR